MNLLERAKQLREDAENKAKAMEAYAYDSKIEIEFRVSNSKSWAKCWTPYWAKHCDYRIKKPTPLNSEQLKALIGTVVVAKNRCEYYVHSVVNNELLCVNIPMYSCDEPGWAFIGAGTLMDCYTSKAGIQLWR